MNTRKQILTVANSIALTLLIGCSSAALAWPSVGEAIQAGQDAGNQTADAAQGAVNDGIDHTQDAVNQGIDDVQDAVNNGPPQGDVTVGGSGQVDIPNPIRHGEEQFNAIGGAIKQGANDIRNGAQDAYNNLENQPGFSVGGKVEVDVNGKKVGIGGSGSVGNPLRDIRHGAEDLANQTEDQLRRGGRDAKRIGRQIGNDAKDAYTNLENQPGFSVGGRAEVDVNGRKVGIGSRVDANNPMRDIREGGEQVYGDARDAARRGRRIGNEMRNDARDAYNDLRNQPGISLRGDGSARVGRGGAQFGMGFGANPYNGDSPRASFDTRRTIQIQPRQGQSMMMRPMQRRFGF